MRILLVSDIHGNLAALQAVLSHAGEFDALWNLGDTVGYGPEPQACLRAMASLHPAVDLAGNHDLVGAGTMSADGFNPVAKQAARWTTNQLEIEEKDYLAALPSVVSIEDVTLAHGSPRDPIWEYVDDEAAAAENFASFPFTTCFVGHTHRPMVARDRRSLSHHDLEPLSDGQELPLGDERVIINPGSVGQPRDGDPRAAYGIVDTDLGRFAAHRTEYDIARTQRAMLAAGLPLPLIERLNIGR